MVFLGMTLSIALSTVLYHTSISVLVWSVINYVFIEKSQSALFRMNISYSRTMVVDVAKVKTMGRWHDVVNGPCWRTWFILMLLFSRIMSG